MATLKELGKNDCTTDFIVFWKGVLTQYRRIPSDNIQIQGSKMEAWAKYQQLGVTPDHVPLLLEQVEKMVDFYIEQSKGIGYSNRLPHIKTWLNQQRFQEAVPNYVAPVVIKKKLATDRPLPEVIETIKYKTYTSEERAKMQVGFKAKIKGVSKRG